MQRGPILGYYFQNSFQFLIYEITGLKKAHSFLLIMSAIPNIFLHLEGNSGAAEGVVLADSGIATIVRENNTFSSFQMSSNCNCIRIV